MLSQRICQANVFLHPSLCFPSTHHIGIQRLEENFKKKLVCIIEFTSNGLFEIAYSIQGKIPRRTDIDGKPANENEIHWKTKQRIMDECFKYRNDHDTE